MGHTWQFFFREFVNFAVEISQQNNFLSATVVTFPDLKKPRKHQGCRSAGLGHANFPKIELNN